MKSFLPEATRVVEPGGKIYINANAANPYGRLPSQAELDFLGLRVVQIKGALDSRFAGQTFMQIGWSDAGQRHFKHEDDCLGVNQMRLDTDFDSLDTA